MKTIDLHVHGKLSKSMPFDPQNFRRIVRHAKLVGLDGIALTEHFHTVNFWHTFDILSSLYDYRDGVYFIDDTFRVLTGAEIGIAEKCDLVLIGSIERLKYFDSNLLCPASQGYKPGFEEAVATAKAAGLIVIGAHMFRQAKPLAKLGRENLKNVSALEMNGRDFHKDRFVAKWAEDLGQAVSGGSDAHFWLQVGIKATITPVDELTPENIASCLAARNTRVRRLRYGPLAIRFSQWYKARVKAKMVAQAGNSNSNTPIWPNGLFVERPRQDSTVLPVQ